MIGKASLLDAPGLRSREDEVTEDVSGTLVGPGFCFVLSFKMNQFVAFGG